MQNHLSTQDAATHLNLSPRTLERWRLEGKGPKFCKFGARVLYPTTELNTWVAQQLQSSTSSSVKA